MHKIKDFSEREVVVAIVLELNEEGGARNALTRCAPLILLNPLTTQRVHVCNNMLAYVDVKRNNKCVKSTLDSNAIQIFSIKDLVVELDIPMEFSGYSCKAVNLVA